VRYTIALAQSRDHVSIVAAETIERYGERFPLRVVTSAYRLPPEASYEDAYNAVVALADKVKATPSPEPRIVVHYAGKCSTVAHLLRDDYRNERRDRSPWVISTAASSADGLTNYVPAKRLADALAVEYHERRIEFASGAPGISRLREQMTRFAPRETRAGNIALGDDELPYDDQVVALMLAAITRGAGEPRFVAGDGHVYASRRVAAQHIGGRLR
jgi:hypothetical protein